MNNIKEILELYFNGETTLEQEEQLKEFFSKDDIPKEFEQDKVLFEYYSDCKNYEPLGNDFNEKVFAEIGKMNTIKLEPNRVIHRILNIAAVLAITIGIYVINDNYQIFNNQNGDVTEKQIKEIKLAENALLTISSYMNKATSGLQKLETVNKAMQQFDKINYFEKYNKLLFNKLGVKS